MGTYAGNTLVDELARRLRDTTNTGYPRATLLSFLNHSQRLINSRLGLVHTTGQFTTAGTSVFDVDTMTTSTAIRLVDIRNGYQQLNRVPWNQLVSEHPQWLRLRGPEPVAWATLGRTLVCITPIPVSPLTLNYVAVKLPTDLTDAGTPTWDLPDEYKPIVLDLAESCMLFRSRHWQFLEMRLMQLVKSLGIEESLLGIRTMGNKNQTGEMPGPEAG